MSGPLTPQQPLATYAPLTGTGVAPTPQPAVDPEVAQAQTYFNRNQAWVKAGDHTYNTPLTPAEEAEFRAYIADRSDPKDLGRNFDPNAKTVDYDLRGWWKAMKAGDEKAKLIVDPNDGYKHRSDYWKTPYHETFSAESQWADPAKAPHWNDKDQLVMPDGTVIFDDRAAH